MSNKGRKATAEMIAAADPPSGFGAILSNSAFGWENGPIFEHQGAEGRRRGFRVAERHINAGGICHGGMIMTFADILLATAVLDVASPPFVTVRMTTDFMDAARLGEWVEGRATLAGGLSDRQFGSQSEDPFGGLVAVAGEMTANGRIIASASGLFKLLARRNKT